MEKLRFYVKFTKLSGTPCCSESRPFAPTEGRYKAPVPRRSPDARGDVCSVSVTTGGAGVGVPARATQRRGAEDGGASPTRASSTPGDTSASRAASLSPHGPWARGRAVHAALLPAPGTGLRPPARRPQHHPARTVAAFVGGRAPPRPSHRASGRTDPLAVTPGVRAQSGLGHFSPFSVPISALSFVISPFS